MSEPKSSDFTLSEASYRQGWDENRCEEERGEPSVGYGEDPRLVSWVYGKAFKSS